LFVSALGRQSKKKSISLSLHKTLLRPFLGTFLQLTSTTVPTIFPLNVDIHPADPPNNMYHEPKQASLIQEEEPISLPFKSIARRDEK
jgi:hypothetical protein